MSQFWFLDLDETLATSVFSWGVHTAIPRLVKRHQLPFNEAIFNQEILVALKRSAHEFDQTVIGNEFFQSLGWSPTLLHELVDELNTDFKPNIFDDTIPFLEKLQKSNATVSIISNNHSAEKIVTALSIDTYVDHIFTPTQCNDSKPKPHADLWDCVKKTIDGIEDGMSIMIGDDPWADGGFSDRCNLQCWIIDRANRFESVRQNFEYQWVRSLLEIPI